MLGPDRGALIADCAAAPGGKTSHLAELAGPGGRVIAIDIKPRGLRAAREVCARLGHRNVEFVCADVSSAMPLREKSFDCVLIDAPCTGIGTLREHPEIRWRVAPADFDRMSRLQLRMIINAAALLKPGGSMVYSVCSIAPAEGEKVIEEFLKANSSFGIDSHPPGYDAMKGLLDDRGIMRTRPDLGGLDGFFAARLIRN